MQYLHALGREEDRKETRRQVDLGGNLKRRQMLRK